MSPRKVLYKKQPNRVLSVNKINFQVIVNNNNNNNNNNLSLLIQDCCITFKKKTTTNAGLVKKTEKVKNMDKNKLQ